MDSGSKTSETDNWHFNPFECLYLVFASRILQSLDWRTDIHSAGIELQNAETQPKMLQDETSVGTCLPATSRMKACQTTVPPRPSSDLHSTSIEDKRYNFEPAPSQILQGDSSNDIASTVQPKMPALSEHSGNTTTTTLKRHLPKSPETCPCNACVFLRDPAYFPADRKNTDSLAIASNGVAPTAPTRASPAPVPNGKPTSPMNERQMEMPQSVASTDPKIAAQQASDMRNIVRRKLTGYVGFANLPNQWHRKSVRKGFNFNVMVVGKLT